MGLPEETKRKISESAKRKIPAGYRWCAGCERILPIDSFHRAGRRPGGRTSYCKECRAKKRRKPRREIVYVGYDSEMPPGHKKCTKCKRVLPLSSFARRKTSHDGLAYRCRGCNASDHKARMADPDNAEFNRERAREWCAQNPQRKRDQVKAWKNANREAFRAIQRNRRARKAGAEGEFSAPAWLALCEEYASTCLCCGLQGPVVPDHVIPLACGGSNGIENIQPLCPVCNSAKGTKSTDYR